MNISSAKEHLTLIYEYDVFLQFLINLNIYFFFHLIINYTNRANKKYKKVKKKTLKKREKTKGRSKAYKIYKERLQQNIVIGCPLGEW